MVKALTTGTTLRVVREVHEDESGAALRFQQGGQGRLALGDANYATHLRLARRSSRRAFYLMRMPGTAPESGASR